MDKRKLRAGRLLLGILVLFVLPATAQAHTQVEGVPDILNGLLHPLGTPSHLLILLGLGLLAGQQQPPNLKTPILVFVPLSAGALLSTLTGTITSVYPPVLICLALCAGTLVALEAPLPRLACIALFAAAALVLGFDSAVETGTPDAVLKRLFGTWLSLSLVVFNLAYYVSLWAKKKWQKVGIRVVGSWLIAISFLVLAFSLRGGK
jgi:hydrogenase/urease accessory protein HupE